MGMKLFICWCTQDQEEGTVGDYKQRQRNKVRRQKLSNLSKTQLWFHRNTQQASASVIIHQTLVSLYSFLYFHNLSLSFRVTSYDGTKQYSSCFFPCLNKILYLSCLQVLRNKHIVNYRDWTWKCAIFWQRSDDAHLTHSVVHTSLGEMSCKNNKWNHVKVPVLVAEVNNPQNTLQLHSRTRLEPFVSGCRLNVSEKCL